MESSPTKSDDGDGDSNSAANKKRNLSKVQLKSTLGSYWNVEAAKTEITAPRPRRSNAGARMKEISEALHGTSKNKSKIHGEDSPGAGAGAPLPEKTKHKASDDPQYQAPKQTTKTKIKIESPKLPELLVPNRPKRPNAGAKLKEMSALLLSPKKSPEAKSGGHKQRKSLPDPDLSAPPVLTPMNLTEPMEEEVQISKKNVLPNPTEGFQENSPNNKSKSISPLAQRPRMSGPEFISPSKSFTVQNISSTKIKLSKQTSPKCIIPTRKNSESNEEQLELEEISHSKAILSALRIPDYLAKEKSTRAKAMKKSAEIKKKYPEDDELRAISEGKKENRKPCVREEDFEILYDPDIPVPAPEPEVQHQEILFAKPTSADGDEEANTKESSDINKNDEINQSLVCSKLYCKMGCICESLRGTVVQDHCGKSKCFFECVCGAKPILGMGIEENNGDIRSRLRPRARLLNWKRLAGLENEDEFDNPRPQPLDKKLTHNIKLAQKGPGIKFKIKRKYDKFKRFKTITKTKRPAKQLDENIVQNEDSNSIDSYNNDVHLPELVWESSSSEDYSPTEEPTVVTPKTYTVRPCLKIPELSLLISPDDGKPQALFRWVDTGVPSSVNVKIEEQSLPLIDLPIPPLGMHWLFYKIPPETDMFSIMSISQPRIQFVLRSLVGKIALSSYRNKTQTFFLVDENRKPLLGKLPCFVFLLPNFPNLLLFGPYPKSSNYNTNGVIQADFRRVVSDSISSKSVGIPNEHFDVLFGKARVVEQKQGPIEEKQNAHVEMDENNWEGDQEYISPEMMELFMESLIIDKESLRTNG